MGGNIVKFTGEYWFGEMPIPEVLESAKEWPLESVLVIGQADDGSLRLGCNTGEMKDIVWLLQRALWEMARQEELISAANREG